MLVRCILPQWAQEEQPSLSKVMEGDFDLKRIKDLNASGYNIYWRPNYPKIYNPGHPVQGSDIDTFTSVFVDFDLKQGQFLTKEAFLEHLSTFPLVPSKVVDSGGGIHAYWSVSDLDAKSYLRLQRRLCRHLKTDEAVAQIAQLMRLPGTINTKFKDNLRPCELLLDEPSIYTCEQLDSALPPITPEDEQYANDHYNKANNIVDSNLKVDDKIPEKFFQLLNNNTEVKSIWSGGLNDRSGGDYRLAHIMLANGFSRDEAMSVLINAAKALQRTPIHRVGYAAGIVDKLWDVKEAATGFKSLSNSVQSLIAKGSETLKGVRFPCHKYLDNTEAGFRLGQVIGLVGGAGIGKTAISLNAFKGFVSNNPEYTHFFVSLEQPEREIALRWDTMCGDNKNLNDKVEVLGNYNEDGTFRNLSLKDIDDYIGKYQLETGKKIGCVAIDHLGVLAKNNKNGENEGLITICQNLKPLALKHNVMVIILSQAPREKSGVGDLELDKDAAYGTAVFEWSVDYLITMWQPLKRTYYMGAPTVTAFKFCKIRHKNVQKDVIQEDKRYRLFFNPETQNLEPMTEDLEKKFDYYYSQSINERKKDKKTDIVEYNSTLKEPNVATISSTKDLGITKRPTSVH